MTFYTWLENPSRTKGRWPVERATAHLVLAGYDGGTDTAPAIRPSGLQSILKALDLELHALLVAAGYLKDMTGRGSEPDFRQHSFRFSGENLAANPNRFARFALLAGERRCRVRTA